jgi:hypothetical protein
MVSGEPPPRASRIVITVGRRSDFKIAIAARSTSAYETLLRMRPSP